MVQCYEFESYKDAIRAQLRSLKARHPHMTLRWAASQVGMQYTYLSKVLNDDNAHLSEDYLFSLSGTLKFTPQETDFLFLLRSRDVTQNPARSAQLRAQIARIRKTRHLKAQEVDGELLTEQMRYLMDPLAVVVHVSLDIEAFAREPHRLAEKLGVGREKLREVLDKLAELGLIQREEGRIVRVEPARSHYGKTHPLMAAHQHLMRVASQNHLSGNRPDENYNFMVTFSGDDECAAEIRRRFDRFIEEVEQLAQGAREKRTYQMNFDFFPWT